ncbi:MAG TPA: DUF481 domain-containing protein [Steroidobacteraceae bacterium]|nr:DUF481 domain-containing protein [Steroidobacteraceae bacterium]
MPGKRSRALCALVALLLGALTWRLATGAETREKTDVITLRNGDRYTGRIIVAQYGYLQLDSKYSGNVSIEWPSVISIETRYGFRVVRFGGLHYAGHIRTTADGAGLIIGSGAQAVTVPMAEVSSVVPYESASFWDRVDGEVSLGYSFTKASDITQGSFGLSAVYSGSSIQGSLQASSVLSRDSTGATTDQDQIQGTAFFLRPSPNFWGFLGVLQRDQSVGIDGRVVTGIALGRRLIETYKSEVVAIIGVAYNQEWPTEGAASQGSAEGVIGADWRVFKFTYPKISLDTSLLIYPSITESPRVRGTLNITLTYKLTERFALKLNTFGNYDSRPPAAGAATTDYAVTTSVSYAFGPVVR